MGWVVKELRTDLFDALRADAERDARRIRRTADRTATSVAGHLMQLEELAVELQATVRRQRASAATPLPRAVPAAAPAVVRPPVLDAAPRARRGARASMRSSPLIELLRATGSRPRFPRALLDVG